MTITTAITPRPIDVSALLTGASDPGSGGTAVFIGTVRETASISSNADKRVLRLEYEAHEPLAETRMREVGEEATARWSLNRFVGVHRTGACELGDPTIVVACSSAHRADCLEACRWAVDEIKATLPIWKKEIYEDGSGWVGAEA